MLGLYHENLPRRAISLRMSIWAMLLTTCNHTVRMHRIEPAVVLVLLFSCTSMIMCRIASERGAIFSHRIPSYGQIYCVMVFAPAPLVGLADGRSCSDCCHHFLKKRFIYDHATQCKHAYAWSCFRRFPLRMMSTPRQF